MMLNRRQYALRYFLTVGSVFLTFLGLDYFPQTLKLILVLPIMIASIWWIVMLNLGRVRHIFGDDFKPLTWIFLTLTPGLNYFLFLFLFFKKGKTLANSFESTRA